MGIVESDLENLARSLLARLSYDYGDAEDVDPDVTELFRRGERLLPVQGAAPDDTKHLERARLRIINLEAERDELRREVQELIAIIEQAQPVVCSMLCISVRKIGHEWEHSALCTRMQATL